MRNYEEIEQIKIINHLKYNYPDILFTISPNGMKLPISVAKKFKAMGYTKGTPDIMIFAARAGFFGFCLEVKTAKTSYNKKGSVSRDQKEWLNKAREEGYYVKVCYGAKEGIELIDYYLKNEEGI